MNDMIQLNDAVEKRSAEKRRKIMLAASAGIIAAVCITAAAVSAGFDSNDTEADLSAYAYVDTEAARASETEAELPEETEAAEEACEYNVNITADGETVSVIASGTVADALEKADISLDEDDILSVSADEEITSDMDVTVIRVDFVTDTRYRRMKYKTEYIEDDTLPEGESRVVTEGQKGRVKVEYRVQLMDGEEISRELINKEVVRHSVSEVIANGTYSAPAETESCTEEEPEYNYPEDTELDYAEEEDYSIEAEEAQTYSEENIEEALTEEDTYNESDYQQEYEPVSADAGSDEGTSASSAAQISQLPVPEDIMLDENGIPTSYTQALHGKSCAYTASEGALMSTGKAVDQGYVAVNPKIIPYGSKLWIVADDGEVYGYAIAADTGGSVGRNDILVDLFMWSYDECIQWGAKNVTIYVIE